MLMEKLSAGRQISGRGAADDLRARLSAIKRGSDDMAGTLRQAVINRWTLLADIGAVGTGRLSQRQSNASSSSRRDTEAPGDSPPTAP